MALLSREDEIRSAYITGLRNMHALEMSAIELTERQTERLEHYPEMKERLARHHGESQEQARRLEGILQRMDASTSSAKNTVSSVMGNVAAALHTPAQDEVLKNTFANFAFEHQEIAAYTSLLVMAEAVGDTAALPPLRQSLSEEQAMADWIEEHIVPTTRRYLELLDQGARAGVLPASGACRSQNCPAKPPNRLGRATVTRLPGVGWRSAPILLAKLVKMR